MTSATHTAVLIAVSLLLGEKMVAYCISLSLSLSPPRFSSAAFPLFPLPPLSSQSMFPPLSSHYSAVFAAQPPEIKWWHCNTAQRHQMCAFQRAIS